MAPWCGYNADISIFRSNYKFFAYGYSGDIYVCKDNGFWEKIDCTDITCASIGGTKVKNARLSSTGVRTAQIYPTGIRRACVCSTSLMVATA
jgi:hypothetical protein